MTLFSAQPNEHLALAKHLTAETKTEEFVAGKGVVVKWERIRRQNHWFDALYNACAAGNGCDVKLVQEIVPPPPPPRPPPDPDQVRFPFRTREERDRWRNWKRW